jgi:hypothetical protein
LEIAQDPRLSGAYNALKAIVGGGAAGFLSKQVVENLLQLMPLLKTGGINIFKRLGYQQPAALYDAHVEGAIQSLDTDHPFYLPIEDQQAAPYGSLLLGPSAAAPLAIGPPPRLVAYYWVLPQLLLSLSLLLLPLLLLRFFRCCFFVWCICSTLNSFSCDRYEYDGSVWTTTKKRPRKTTRTIIKTTNKTKH